MEIGYRKDASLDSCLGIPNERFFVLNGDNNGIVD
jgi:hypothetical protein